MESQRPSDGREWRLIGILTFVGAVLRFWAFGRLGLDHFDEGIYAFSGSWIADDRMLFAIDPMVIPYAPPGFPILVGLAYLVFGLSDHAAILVATVCGVATIPVVGWLSRRTFGPGAGVASATFAALAMAHVAFSRKAMTDAPFLLAWLLAIGQGARFLELPGPGRAIALGLAIGLAQNLKYNGWLVGALVIAAALAGVLSRGENRSPGPLLRTFGWGLAAALAAALVYAPWFGFVESHGGYAALLRHHRSYLSGPSSWWPNWNQQLGQAHALSGSRPWGALSWGLAWLSHALAAKGPRGPGSWTCAKLVRAQAEVVLGAVLLGVQPNFPWWLGLAWSPLLLWAGAPSARLLGAWWLVLSILTPLYHPYARLWLPLHAVGWLLLGGLIAGAFPARVSGFARRDEHAPGRESRIVSASLAVVALVLSAIPVVRTRPYAMPWTWVLEPSRTNTLRHFATDNVPRLAIPEGRAIRVLARRPLAFYLVRFGRAPIALEPDVDGLSRQVSPDTWAVLDEAILVQEGNPEERLGRLLKDWRLAETFANEVDPVTLLDIHPGAAFQPRPARVFKLWVLTSPAIPRTSSNDAR